MSLDPEQQRLPTHIRLTCRACGSVRTATRHAVQDFLRVRAPGRITVDWEGASAVHTCRACTQRARMQADNAAVVKRHGRAALRARGQRLAAWGTDHPDERQALSRAVAAQRTIPQPSALDIARRGIANFHLELTGVLGLCLLCHRLVYTEAANARRVRTQGSGNVGRFHRTCYLTWHQSDVMRAWVSACRRAGTASRPKPEMPIPPRPSARTSSPKELIDGYRATVRYFWHTQGSAPAARDEHGEVRSIAWLAQDLDVSRRALYDRVQRFLALLPDQHTAMGRVKAWRDVFLTINGEHAGDR